MCDSRQPNIILTVLEIEIKNQPISSDLSEWKLYATKSIDLIDGTNYLLEGKKELKRKNNNEGGRKYECPYLTN